MTVKELIEKLSKYDNDSIVYHKITGEITQVESGPLNYLYDKPEDRIIIII